MDKGVLAMSRLQKVQSGIGTRVAVDKDGLIRVIPANQEFELQEDEKEITRIREIDINIVPDDIINARMELYIKPTEITAEPRQIEFHSFDPNDHFAEKRVARIEFEDGSVWDWEE